MSDARLCCGESLGLDADPLTGLADDPRAPVRRAVATDDRTHPAVLARLAEDGNYWVRQAACRNPHLPPKVLSLLRAAGSTADLSGFADPDPTLPAEVLAQLARGGEWARRLVARHPATPAEALQRLASDPLPGIRRQVAVHPSVPSDLLYHLLEDEAAEVRQAASAHPRSPREHVLLLERAEQLDPTLAAPALRLLAAGGPWARQQAARHPATPPDVLAQLGADRLWPIRAAVAANPAVPSSVLLVLARRGGASLLPTLLANPSCPAEVLVGLADTEDLAVLVPLLGHANLPPACLARLAEHGSSWVREQVGQHPRLPAAARSRLCRSGSTPDLLGFAPPDPTLPAEGLVELARGGSWARQLAAHHPATPPDVLAELLADDDFLVRRLAACHPQTSGATLDLLVRAGSSRDLDGFGPADPALPADTLAVLADSGPWARRLAARHANTDSTVLAQLGADAIPSIRAAVAAHTRTPAAVLVQLAQDEQVNVRWQLVRRPELPDAVLRKLATDRQAMIRAAVAARADIPADVDAALGRDWDEDVREALVRNADRTREGNFAEVPRSSFSGPSRRPGQPA